MIGQKDEILKDENISLDVHKVLNFLLHHRIFFFFYYFTETLRSKLFNARNKKPRNYGTAQLKFRLSVQFWTAVNTVLFRALLGTAIFKEVIY